MIEFADAWCGDLAGHEAHDDEGTASGRVLVHTCPGTRTVLGDAVVAVRLTLRMEAGGRSATQSIVGEVTVEPTGRPRFTHFPGLRSGLEGLFLELELGGFPVKSKEGVE